MSRVRPLCWLWLLVLWVPGSAQAFHAAQTFADPPEQGGGGGIFYAGTTQERGWTCTACHVERAADTQARFVTELFDKFEYEPGRSYPVTIRLSEELGQSSPRSNYNGFVLSMLTEEGLPAGRVTEAPADRYYVRSNSAGNVSVLATAGQDPNETEWTFTWVALQEGTGRVIFALGLVDGNGANSPPDDTLTDPFGDGVYMANVAVEEGPPAAGAPPFRRAPLVPETLPAAFSERLQRTAGALALLLAFLLGMARIGRLGRRGRGQHA